MQSHKATQPSQTIGLKYAADSGGSVKGMREHELYQGSFHFYQLPKLSLDKERSAVCERTIWTIRSRHGLHGAPILSFRLIRANNPGYLDLFLGCE